MVVGVSGDGEECERNFPVHVIVNDQWVRHVRWIPLRPEFTT